MSNCVHDPYRNNMSFNAECNDDIVVPTEEVVSAVLDTGKSSVISKVVEIILLNRISKLLSTCSNQFGFQQKLGTDTCISTF